MTSQDALTIANTQFPSVRWDCAMAVPVQTHESSQSADTWICYSSQDTDVLAMTDGIEIYLYSVLRRIRL